MPLFTYFRPLLSGNPTSNHLLNLQRCWWSCSSLCPLQISPWFPMPQFLLKQVHWINISREVETQLYKIHKQANWLKEVSPLWGSFFDLILAGLGYGYPGSFVLSKPWDCFVANYYYYYITFIYYLYYYNNYLPNRLHVLKSLNACGEPVTSWQMVSLRLEWQKRTEEHNQLLE